MNPFIQYVYNFYGPGGIFDMGATVEQIKDATIKYITTDPDSWGGGDTTDREEVREILAKDYGLHYEH